jgi:hypothetical protein
MNKLQGQFPIIFQTILYLVISCKSDRCAIRLINYVEQGTVYTSIGNMRKLVGEGFQSQHMTTNIEQIK